MLSIRRLALILGMVPCALSASGGEASRPPVLSLSRAVEYALSRAPEAAAARHELEAREAEALQSRLPDNPEFRLEAENLDARGAMAEGNREFTASLNQTLDASRFGHAAVARSERERARLDLMALERRLRAQTRVRFVAVQAGQDRIGLSGELLALARRAHGAAAEKVAAGKAPPTDSLQSYMALSQARIDSARAARELASARRELALACGIPDTGYDSAEGGLAPARSVPPWEIVAARIPESPEWRRIAMGARVGEAEVRRERLARIPSVTLAAGIRQIPEKDGRAFVAGISMPLPAWNRNQGAVRAAESRKLKAEAEGEAERARLIAGLASLRDRASAARLEAETLRDRILPAAAAAFEGAQEAYRAGKFGSLDALNAQRSLFEARARYLEALEDFNVALAGLEESIGGGVFDGPSGKR